MAYLLDTNVFISAKNLHYGFDFCPAFWEWVIEQNKVGLVFSIEKVGGEIGALLDDLSVWAAPLGTGFFLVPDAGAFPALGAVSTWASTGGHYEQAAISTFLQLADYYIVAQALAGNFTVVTHEVPSASRRKIKIPDACIALGVKWATPYEMLRRENARFVLGA